jgi:hypothetical protein
MPVTVEKRITARQRQKRVAEAYADWLKNNPKANRKRRIQALDALSDSAFLQERLEKNG